MEDYQVALSVDELGMAAVLAGKPEYAKSLLFSLLGSLDEREMKGRLVSAGDSLVSKGLVMPNGEGMVLSAELARIIQVITSPQYSLRLSKIARDFEEGAIYHYSLDNIVEQKVEKGIVFVLRMSKGTNEIVKYGMNLFQVKDKQSAKITEESIPYQILEIARGMNEEAGAISKYLQESGMSDETAAMIAADIKSSRYRGAVMRIEYTEEEARSDKGFLVLAGEERTWLFVLYSDNDNTMARILPGGRENLEMEIEALTG